MFETLEKVIIVCIVFVLGMLAASVYQDVRASEESPATAMAATAGDQMLQDNPSDWVKEDSIRVYNDRVILTIDRPQWAKFTDTHSMEPVLSATANAVEIVPESEDDIKVGDIVSYESEYADGAIIHRVIEKGTDSQGTYFILKGDNNPTQDPGKVRFSQILRVVVAIIY